MNTDLHWKMWVTIGLAGASTFATQACELPIQNVIFAAAVIGLAGAVGGTLNELASAKLMLQSKILGGEARVGFSFWGTPIVWVVLLLNSRGVAKRILCRWRGAPNYGFWVLSTTSILVMALETSALAVNLSVTDGPVSREWGKPWVHLAVWTGLVVATLVVAAPILINKSPAEREPSAEPVIIWLAMAVVVLSVAVQHGAWWAVGLLGLTTALIGISAVPIQRRSEASLQHTR